MRCKFTPGTLHKTKSNKKSFYDRMKIGQLVQVQTCFPQNYKDPYPVHKTCLRQRLWAQFKGFYSFAHKNFQKLFSFENILKQIFSSLRLILNSEILKR